MLGGKFDKMSEVCNDVLQLEKLVKGGFAFVFRSADVAAWLEEQAGNSRGALKRGVDFVFEGLKSTVSVCVPVVKRENGKQSGQAGESSERVREGGTLLAVADFLRLEQVISNFVTIASKSSVSGKVQLHADLRDVASEEMKCLESLLQTSKTSDEEKTTGREKKKPNDVPSESVPSPFLSPFFIVFCVLCSALGFVTERLFLILLSKSGSNSKQADMPGGKGRPEDPVGAQLQKQWVAAMTELIDLEEASAKRSAERRLSASLKESEKEKKKPCHILRWAVLEVAVSSTGAALDPEEVAHLFKPYAQVRAGDLQNGGGSGLGLSIARGFVEAHGGGQIGAVSDGIGMGSRFFFKHFVPLFTSYSSTGTASRVHSSLSGGVSPSLSPVPFDRHEGENEKEQKKGDRALGQTGGEGEKTEDKESRRVSHKRPSSSEAAVSESSFGESPSPSQSQYQRESLADPGRSTQSSPTGRGRRHGTPRRCSLEAQALAVLFQEDSKEKEKERDEGNRGEQSDQQREEVKAETGEVQEKPPQSADSVSGMTPHAAPTPVRRLFEQEAPGAVTADVLLVDDDKFCLMAGGAAIRRLGYSVAVAEDGEEAIDLIVRKRGSFPLVLMDNSMPKIKGPEATREIMNYFRTRQKETKSVEVKKPSVYDTEQDALLNEAAPLSEKMSPSEGRGEGREDSQLVPLILGCTGETCDSVADQFKASGAGGTLHKPSTATKLAEVLSQIRKA
uniref:histidine kinase n=1 Tax=Chromera velia CCMP2878 TaxID=1169474 RepID=A0A0G4HQS8_9ALVE|eukprot:Cvel_30308.t1-p1 / transcript=Cvel_30308.t1 / gene=Cvel_30308 / organism=Chromera_velia_CCMP2878 / gene_product=hypothetical protein / transcript_product=hypothetical protein / location=Cvel_scaffold4300:8030-10228(-) / protein_length=733 / sequence_SO=supercontig / SO=protein_coding / is_pseudo=false